MSSLGFAKDALRHLQKPKSPEDTSPIHRFEGVFHAFA